MLPTVAERLMKLATRVPLARRDFLRRATATLGSLAILPVFARAGLFRQSCPDTSSCVAGYDPCGWQICEFVPPEEIAYCDECFEACAPTTCYYSQTYVVAFWHSYSCYCVVDVGYDPGHECDESC